MAEAAHAEALTIVLERGLELLLVSEYGINGRGGGGAPGVAWLQDILGSKCFIAADVSDGALRLWLAGCGSVVGFLDMALFLAKPRCRSGSTRLFDDR